jgi:hypothetical protein
MTVEFLSSSHLNGSNVHWFEVGGEAYGVTDQEMIVDGQGRYRAEDYFTVKIRKAIDLWLDAA